jgi:ribonuclease BN (tRNA processing enzyme)
MASSTITFFPVGEKNGGMTLIKLNDKLETSILIDCSIGTDLIADYCDVNEELRNRLPEDVQGRPYVDAFILTHRHEDHVKGLQDNFHLGSLSNYDDTTEIPKIVIRELWSSHIYWKPESENYSLCDNAKAFNKEMKRRTELYKSKKTIQQEGDRAIIIGNDPDGRTDGLEVIKYDIGNSFSKINERNLDGKLKGLILSPINREDSEDDEAFFDHNRQSVVIQFTISENDFYSRYDNKILMSADAECLVWEKLWKKYVNRTQELEYDILYTPHHCSWHSLSYDSQSKVDDPQICEDAKKALSRKKSGAFAVSQSKIITDKTDDPPSVEAKKEYQGIVGYDKFMCTNEYPNAKEPEPIEFNLTSSGPQKKSVKAKPKLTTASSQSTRESYPHG